jgi:hypothetical protein
MLGRVAGKDCERPDSSCPGFSASPGEPGIRDSGALVGPESRRAALALDIGQVFPQVRGMGLVVDAALLFVHGLHDGAGLEVGEQQD